MNNLADFKAEMDRGAGHVRTAYAAVRLSGVGY